MCQIWSHLIMLFLGYCIPMDQLKTSLHKGVSLHRKASKENTPRYRSFSHHTYFIVIHHLYIYISFFTIIFTSISCDTFGWFSTFSLHPSGARRKTHHGCTAAYKEPSRWSKACWEGRGASWSPTGQECRLPTKQINSSNMYCIHLLKHHTGLHMAGNKYPWCNKKNTASWRSPIIWLERQTVIQICKKKAM